MANMSTGNGTEAEMHQNFTCTQNLKTHVVYFAVTCDTPGYHDENAGIMTTLLRFLVNVFLWRIVE